MSLDKETTAPESEKKETGTEKITQVAKQDILDLSKDEDLQKMKDRYGDNQSTFIKWLKEDEEFGPKCKWLLDSEILALGLKDPDLKRYYEQEIKAKRKPEQLSKEDQAKLKDNKIQDKEKNNPYENYDAEWWLRDNEKWETFKQSEYDRLRKEKWEAAAFAYKDKRRNASKPGTKKPEEKIPEAPKSDSKPTEKPAEPEKKEKKSFRKKLNPKIWFPKKEKKTDQKEGGDTKPKKGFWKTTGDVVTYLPKQAWKWTKAVGKATRKWIKAIPHQTWNLVSYAPRVARHTILKYPFFDWINHGFNKPGLKKNRDNYASKWKWEQGEKGK